MVVLTVSWCGIIAAATEHLLAADRSRCARLRCTSGRRPRRNMRAHGLQHRRHVMLQL